MMAKIETAAHDAADYLNTAEDVVAYIDAYLEDGSKEVRAAIETVARSGGISELAERTAVSCVGLSEALGATATPSFEGIRSIMHALGLRLTVQVATGTRRRVIIGIGDLTP